MVWVLGCVGVLALSWRYRSTSRSVFAVADEEGLSRFSPKHCATVPPSRSWLGRFQIFCSLRHERRNGGGLCCIGVSSFFGLFSFFGRKRRKVCSETFFAGGQEVISK